MKLNRAALAFAAVTLMSAAALHAGTVNVNLSPANQVVNVGDIVEVNLIVSAQSSSQAFDALDAIIGWDTSYLNLITFDNSSAGAAFFLTGFLNDPDDINDDVTDGDALFNAFAVPGNPVVAPLGPTTLIVTTFKFQALAPTIGTDVVLIPQIGAFGETRVLLNGLEVTGSALGPATITIVPAPAAMGLLAIAGFAGTRRRRSL